MSVYLDDSETRSVSRETYLLYPLWIEIDGLVVFYREDPLPRGKSGSVLRFSGPLVGTGGEHPHTP